MKILKRNGKLQDFNFSQIHTALSKIVDDEKIINRVLGNAKLNFREGISTDEITGILIQSCVDLTTIESPIYDHIAKDLAYEQFLKNKSLPRGNKDDIILKSMSYAGIITFIRRYSDGYNLTNFFEINKDASCVTDKGLIYLNSSPTLFNNKRTGDARQLSSCFEVNVPDSTEGITNAQKEVSLYSRYAGGIGLHVSEIRERGASIGSEKGVAKGVVATIKLFEEQIKFFDQQGKRTGSMAVYLDCTHPDIMEFLHCQDLDGDQNHKLHSIFMAVNIRDNFMNAVIHDNDYYLFSPKETVLHNLYGKEFEDEYDRLVAEKKYHSVVKARDIFNKVLEQSIKKSCFIMFKDTASISAGRLIKGSNLCTEIMGVTNDTTSTVCNLASLNLNKINGLDVMEINLNVYEMVKSLIDVVKTSKTPHEKGDNFQKTHKMIGAGVMGFAQWLDNQGIDANSYEAVEQTEALASVFSKAVKQACENLNFNPLHAMAIAPTESISVLANCSKSIEFPKDRIYNQDMKGGQLKVFLPNYKGRLAFEVPLKQQVNFVSAWQKYIDQSISFNMYVPTNSKLIQDIADKEYLIKGLKNIHGSEEVVADELIELARMQKELILDREKQVEQLAKATVYAWKKGLKTRYYVYVEQAHTVKRNICEMCSN